MSASIVAAEAPQVLGAVVARLKADAGAGGVNTLVGGRIYRDVADESALYPRIVVAVLSSPAVTTANGIHVFSNVQIMVTIWDQSSSRSGVTAIESRTLAMLDQYGEVTRNGVYIVLLRLVEQVPLPDEFDQGVRYVGSRLVFFTEAQPA